MYQGTMAVVFLAPSCKCFAILEHSRPELSLVSDFFAPVHTRWCCFAGHLRAFLPSCRWFLPRVGSWEGSLLHSILADCLRAVCNAYLFSSLSSPPIWRYSLVLYIQKDILSPVRCSGFFRCGGAGVGHLLTRRHRGRCPAPLPGGHWFEKLGVAVWCGHQTKH